MGLKVLSIEPLDRRLRSPRRKVCIDIDMVDKATGKHKGWEAVYALLKAQYSYSYISREVRKTQHGFHVYLDLNVFGLGCDGLYVLRAMLGDDPQRLELDEKRCKHGYWINVCFTSSEQYNLL